VSPLLSHFFVEEHQDAFTILPG